MKHLYYTLVVATLLVSACNKEKQHYKFNNTASRTVHVRFYQNQDDYYTNNNIVYSTIVAPGETQDIPLDGFPMDVTAYMECFTNDFKSSSWPEELRPVLTRKANSSSSDIIQPSFMPTVADRAVPGVFFGEGVGSYWTAVSKNGVPVTGNEYTMTIRKDQTITINNGPSTIECSYSVFIDTYPFGVAEASVLVHGDTVLRLVQGEASDPYNTAHYYYPHPTVGSDSIAVIIYDNVEVLFKRMNYL